MIDLEGQKQIVVTGADAIVSNRSSTTLVPCLGDVH